MKRLSMAMTALAVMGLMTMVSCRKPNVGNVPGEARTITFNATTESNAGSKTYLDGLDVKWSENDKINVNGTEFNLVKGENTTFGSFTGTVGAVSGGYLACYPADATNDGNNITFTIPTPQDGDADFDSKLPMAAYTTNETADLAFKNMVNVLKLDLTGTQTIKTIEVESTENLNGTFTVGESLTPTAISGSESTQKKITIDYTGGPLDLTTNPTVYVVLPVFGSAESTVTVKFTGDAGVMTVGPKALTGSDKPNHRYTADVAVTLVAPKFSVSADKTVKFSKGNLWYGTASSKDAAAFHFESNQWDFAVNGGSWNPDHISRFYWCKSSAEAVKQDYEETGTTASDVFFTNTSETEGSFTVDSESGWRTLSQSEFGYLLGTRKVTVGGEQKASYGQGTVNDVQGLIILPDNWDGSVCPGFTYGKSNWSNTFTESTTPKWSAMESAGAVFLPAAGGRDGSGVGGVGSFGCYWSSTHGGSGRAINVDFASGFVELDNRSSACGFCVRLVR